MMAFASEDASDSLTDFKTLESFCGAAAPEAFNVSLFASKSLTSTDSRSTSKRQTPGRLSQIEWTTRRMALSALANWHKAAAILLAVAPEAEGSRMSCFNGERVAQGVKKLSVHVNVMLNEKRLS